LLLTCNARAGTYPSPPPPPSVAPGGYARRLTSSLLFGSRAHRRWQTLDRINPSRRRHTLADYCDYVDDDDNNNNNNNDDQPTYLPPHRRKMSFYCTICAKQPPSPRHMYVLHAITAVYTYIVHSHALYTFPARRGEKTKMYTYTYRCRLIVTPD